MNYKEYLQKKEYYHKNPDKFIEDFYDIKLTWFQKKWSQIINKIHKNKYPIIK